MNEKINHHFENKKYSPEDIKFFNNLVEKYHIKQTSEYLIISQVDKEIYIHKWRKILINGEWVKIEDHLKKILSNKDEHET
ncbi:hypothetical protein KKG58_04680 [Patescibacteria group bacterium]|nr:hypothetical protein [Patescibacteria group bacterium]